MAQRAASPMSALSVNKENATAAAAPSAKPTAAAGKRAGNSGGDITDNGGSGGEAALPNVQLNAVVVSLVEENEEMMRTIATLTKDQARMQGQLEHAARLEAEVNALRAELGYVTADTTDTKYKVQDYKKIAEQLQRTVGRLEEENEANKKLLDEAAAREKTAREVGGTGGCSSLKADEHVQQAHKEMAATLRKQRHALAYAKESFARLQSTATPTASATAEELAGLSQRFLRYCAPPLEEMRQSVLARGGLERDLLLPMMECSQEMQDFCHTVLTDYAAARLAQKK